MKRVPVLNIHGKPLMPTKESRAKRWIKEGKAVGKWSKLGIFYVQLNIETGENTQDIFLGVDPGSKWDGMAVVSRKEILISSMLELPKNIVKKLEQRSNQRRTRRSRKWRRPCRFNNKEKKKNNWISPSQNSKVNFRIKIIKEYQKLFPISKIIVEDVKFNHRQHRHGEYFSTVEIGKTKLYNYIGNNLVKVSGVDTYNLRNRYDVKKSSNKAEKSVKSHAIDAIVMACGHLNIDILDLNGFFFYKRNQYSRRQLHRFQFDKGGIRKRYGGSDSLSFKKGDIVKYKGKTYRVGGNTKGKLSLHDFSTDKRFAQNAKIENCEKLYNQKVIYQKIYSEIEYREPLDLEWFLQD